MSTPQINIKFEDAQRCDVVLRTLKTYPGDKLENKLYNALLTAQQMSVRVKELESEIANKKESSTIEFEIPVPKQEPEPKQESEPKREPEKEPEKQHKVAVEYPHSDPRESSEHDSESWADWIFTVQTATIAGILGILLLIGISLGYSKDTSVKHEVKPVDSYVNVDSISDIALKKMKRLTVGVE